MDELMNRSETLRKTTHEVQTALLPKEHAMVIETIRNFGKTKQFPSVAKKTQLVPDGLIPVAKAAKELGRRLYP